jgi:hypothetical protein
MEVKLSIIENLREQFSCHSANGTWDPIRPIDLALCFDGRPTTHIVIDEIIADRLRSVLLTGFVPGLGLLSHP